MLRADQRWIMGPMRSLLCLLTLLFISSHAVAGAWVLAVDEREGLPMLTVGGASAVSANFAFWGANWAWAGPATKFKVVKPYSYAISSSIPALGLALEANAMRLTDNLLAWRFNLDARSDRDKVMGGGLVFKFDLPSFGAEMGDPELLPKNAGWRWGHGAKRIEMHFEPPLASVYFERGQKSEIRAYFYSGVIAKGAKTFTAMVTTGNDIALGTTQSERYGDDAAMWPANNMDWRTSAVDLSFLNETEKPAGKRGFIRADKERLVFADGTAARFWGANLTAAALFGTPKDQVLQQAKRLSALGFNLVRIHHHDSEWVSPNVFGDPRVLNDTSALSEAMLEKLDWWITCLKTEGIYVWLDLHVGRHMHAGDGIDAFEELSKGARTGEGKGYNYVNPTIVAAMKKFNQSYVSHTNRYTGLSYKDEPAIMAMLISNENDVTHHFGNLLLPDKNVPKHNAWYMAKADGFARKYGLNPELVWHSWEHGPSKLFLNDLEHDFDVEMASQLRGLGVKVPLITTSSWGYMPLSSLPALTSGDIIDVHSYGGAGEIERDPHYKANLMHWIAAGQVAGKPLSVTEWNVEQFPVVDRHTIPLYIASAAAHQGWDALMIYAYAQVPLTGPGGPSNWHAFNDPSLINTLPAAALLFRAGHVHEATTRYVYAPDPNTLYFKPVSPDNSIALRVAAERGKLVVAMPTTKELSWLKAGLEKAGASTTVFSDPNRDLGKLGTDEIVSDNGELKRNWASGTYVIDTPRTQALLGWSSGKPTDTADVHFEITTRNTAVAVQSMDAQPIRSSGRILVSLSARSAPRVQDRLPFMSELVEGVLTIRAPEGLVANTLSSTGQKPRPIDFSYEDGRYRIPLTKAVGSFSILLLPESTP